MSPESVNRYANSIFMAIRTENNICEAAKLPIDTIYERGTLMVKRELIEFAIDIIQTMSREVQHADNHTLENMSEKIATLEKLKWENQ